MSHPSRNTHNCIVSDFLPHQQQLADMLLRNGAIETLDLAYNPVGPEGLRRLSSFVFSNVRLKTLGLRGCGVQPDGVKSGIYALARCAFDTCMRLKGARVFVDECAMCTYVVLLLHLRLGAKLLGPSVGR